MSERERETVMAFEFDYSGEPEYSAAVPDTQLTVHVSAAGGGTVGERYAQYWDTAIEGPFGYVDKLEYALDGGDAMSCGTPSTHEEIARVRAGFAANLEDARFTPQELDALALFADEDREGAE